MRSIILSGIVLLLSLSGCPNRLPAPCPGPDCQETTTPLLTFDGPHGCETEVDEQYYEFESGSQGLPALHVVSVHEGVLRERANGTVAREVRILLERPGPAVLVLSAYSPTTWRISVAEGALLTKVIASGFYRQRVFGPRGVPLIRKEFVENNSILGLGYQWPSYDTKFLTEAAEEASDTLLTSFRGCHSSRGFRISEPLAKPSPAPAPPLSYLPAGCSHIAQESIHCIALVAQGTFRLAALGLDSGSLCLGPHIDQAIDSGNSPSLGWHAGYGYYCLRERGLLRINLADGSTEVAAIPCLAATSDGNTIYVYDTGLLGPDAILTAYDSFEKANAEWPTARYPWPFFASRFAVKNGSVIAAWQSDNKIQIAPVDKYLHTSQVQEVPLQNFDNWIFGIDQLSDGRFVVVGPNTAGSFSLYLFDGRTGAQVGRVTPAFEHLEVAGISCRERSQIESFGK